METINDRMEMLVNERFGGNKAAFAKAIDLPPTGISSYLGNKRRSLPSCELAAKIVKNLDVDARWLLTGEESKTVSNHVATNGDFSPASMHGDVSVGAEALLTERIKHLEDVIAEKERLIKLYERMVEK